MKTALKGQGVLAIWNGIAAGHETEFLRWHVMEHIPERVSVPGFICARRYVALSGSPAYFNFYEVADVSTLHSDAYLVRLNDPSDWTKRVVPHFTDTSRTLCKVVESRGHGIAGTMITIKIDGPAAPLRPLVAALSDAPDVSAAHLLEQDEGPSMGTAESAMRDHPDATASTILLVEGAEPNALEQAVNLVASDEIISDAVAGAKVVRGKYQLDFVMM